jgi:hypothetical protein
MVRRADEGVVVSEKSLHARLACGCRLGFRSGVEGSPVTVLVEKKADGCPIPAHVSGLPVYDHREALRPSTRLGVHLQPDYEGEG